MECRTCERQFKGLKAFDAHLGSDRELVAGRGHHDPYITPKEGSEPTVFKQDDRGVWSSVPTDEDRERFNSLNRGTPTPLKGNVEVSFNPFRFSVEQNNEFLGKGYEVMPLVVPRVERGR